MGACKCRQCGVDFVAVLYKEYFFFSKKENKLKKSNYHRDLGGRPVRLSKCSDCVLGRIREVRDVKPREFCDYAPIKKAAETEIFAQRFFENLGFSVQRTIGRGPDLFCRIGRLTWTVEVKPAQRGRGGTYTTAPVLKSRQCDDLVAIVLPGLRVYLDSMKEHLSRCPASGRRSITKMVRVWQE